MDFNSIIQSDKPVLIDFFAEWCGPCKSMAPILKEVKDKVGNSAQIIKIDVDKNPKLSAKYGIRSVPTLMIFKNGKEMWKKSGVFPSNQLVNLINQYK
jgi:thioredoxin 1